jgi:hypothetical protein
MSDSDALEIHGLATELEGVYSNQRALDNLVNSQFLQRHIVETIQPKGKKQIIPIKPVGAGFAARVVKEDVSFLSAQPFARVNAPKSDQEKKASQLEAALQGIARHSAYDPQIWVKGVTDLALFGRCWWNVYPNPKAWSGVDFDQGDEDEEEFIERVLALKRDRFPIVWRNIEARNTWCTWKGNGQLDEVVEIRSMTKRQIEQAYGPGYVSEDAKHHYGYRDEIKVIEYADDTDCKTVVCAAQPALAYEFAHGLGTNPYVLAQQPPPPPNEFGWYWTGSTFDLRHVIEEIDGRLADINWNIRQATRAGKVAYVSPELRMSDPETAGAPPSIDIVPDGLTVMWMGEKIETLLPNAINADTYRFIELVMGFARESHVRPILTGALQSGQSGVLYNTAVQLAEKDFGPTLDSLKHAYEDICKRFLRSARVITEDGDTIPIYHSSNGTNYSLELTNKDTRGWDNLIQGRISVAVPLNENAQVATAKLATSSQPGSPALLSVRTASAKYLGIEDRDYEQQSVDSERLAQAVIDALIPMAQERALQLAGGQPVASDSLGQRIQALPESFQQAVQIHAGRLGQAVPQISNSNRGAMNQVRTGVQTPSQTEATRAQVTPNAGGY